MRSILRRGSGKRAPHLEKLSGREVLDQPLEKPPVFAVGSGRCGTHFLHALMDQDPDVISFHTDTMGFSEADSFARYCVWNGLPVDLGATLQARQRYIDQSRARGAVYFESNAYLGFCVDALHDRFEARFIVLIRDPAAVVNSHFVKGWYREPVVRDDPRRAPGLQPGWRVNHSFGRIVPHADDLARWEGLTRIGKIAWMLNVVYREIMSRLSRLPDEHWRVAKLEGVDYERYRDLHAFVGGSRAMDEADFDRIRSSRPGKAKSHRAVDSWSEREMSEFAAETREIRELFGY